MQPGSWRYVVTKAAQHAARVRPQQTYTVCLNSTRMMNRSYLEALVHNVMSTAANMGELQSLAVVFREAECESFEPEQIAAKIADSPYAWLIRMLPENKDQTYSFVQVLSAILALIISVIALRQQPQAPVIVTPDLEKRIIEQLEELIEEDSPGNCAPEAPLPTAPQQKLKQSE